MKHNHGQPDEYYASLKSNNYNVQEKTPLVSARNLRRNYRRSKLLVIFHLSIVLLILLIAFAFLLTARLALQLPPDSTTRGLITENTTILLGTYKIRKYEEAVAFITEKILEGDSYHINYYAIVPSSDVIVHSVFSQEKHTVVPITDDAVTVDDRYVYMLTSSVLNYDICLGDAQEPSETMFYGFSSEDSYNNYVTSSWVFDSVLSKKVQIGGPGNIICTKASFTANSTGYYFFVLKTKYAHTNVTYAINASINMLSMKDYLSDSADSAASYSSCRLDEYQPSCSLSFSQPGSWSLIGSSDKNYDLGPRQNHVQVTVSRKRDHNWNVIYQLLLFGSVGLFIGSIVYMVVLLVVNFVTRIRDKKHSISITSMY